jgi:hypothetical protein
MVGREEALFGLRRGMGGREERAGDGRAMIQDK